MSTAPEEYRQTSLGVEEIEKLLLHRYPFLLIDRVIGYQHGKYLQAIKSVTATEPFFQGHFPGRPIMPGVLIVEAMAQAAGALISLSFRDQLEMGDSAPLYYLTGIDKVRIRRPVVPGDRLLLEARVGRIRSRLCIFSTTASVDGETAATAELRNIFPKREDS